MRRFASIALLGLFVLATGSSATAAQSKKATVRQFASVVAEWRTKIDAAWTAELECAETGAPLECSFATERYDRAFDVVNPTANLGVALTKLGKPPSEIKALVKRTITQGRETDRAWVALNRCLDKVRGSGTFLDCETAFAGVGDINEATVSLMAAWDPYS
jgi:hypothetical protein